VVGNIGSPKRLEYTSIRHGEHRLPVESLTKELGWMIIASDQTVAPPDRVRLGKRRELSLKGRKEGCACEVIEWNKIDRHDILKQLPTIRKMGPCLFTAQKLSSVAWSLQ
jgi:hypothetical protein